MSLFGVSGEGGGGGGVINGKKPSRRNTVDGEVLVLAEVNGTVMGAVFIKVEQLNINKYKYIWICCQIFYYLLFN